MGSGSGFEVAQDAEDVLGLGLGILGVVGLELVDCHLRLGMHSGERLDLFARLIRVRVRVRARARARAGVGARARARAGAGARARARLRVRVSVRRRVGARARIVPPLGTRPSSR